MNADTVMTDQPALQAQTPQSQVSASTPGGGGGGGGGGGEPARAPPTPGSTGWNTSKFQQEYDLVRARLQGQFDMRDYPDPLLPRDPPQLPRSMPPERAQQLRDLKAQIVARLSRA